jgi:hypothetical protein
MNADTPLKLIMGYCVLALTVFGTLVVGLANGSDKQCWLPEGCKAVTQPVYQDNPYTYKAGAITTVSRVDGALVVRMQPTGTYALFTEDIMLCDYVNGGDIVNAFIGKKNPMVLTYGTQAHRTVQGVGCHQLVRVDELR